MHCSTTAATLNREGPFVNVLPIRSSLCEAVSEGRRVCGLRTRPLASEETVTHTLMKG